MVASPQDLRTTADAAHLTGGPAYLDYRPALDGLRALAILAVMLFHAKVPWARGGWLGVDVFFVLSGFLITALLVAERDRHGRIHLRHFYARRALRLLPALVVLLVAFCAYSYAVVFEPKAKLNYQDALITLFYLSNWARAYGVHPPDYLGHTWSLSIEEQFYLAWPALLILALRLPWRRRVVAAAVAAVAVGVACLRYGMFEHGATAMRLYNGTDTRADSLLLGSAAALWLSATGTRESPGGSRAGRLALRLGGIAAFAALGYVAATTYWNADAVFRYGFFVIAALSMLALLSLLLDESGPVAQLLSQRPLVWIGRRSYGLYLFHYPIFRGLRDHGMTTDAVLVVGGLASFAMAAACYALVERPALRLKRRFPQGQVPSG